MSTRTRHNLTAIKIKNLIRAAVPLAVSDGAGLTLTISASGYASWVLRYRFEGKRKEVTIGSYQDFPLSVAREVAVELRRKIEGQIDPSREKIAHKAAQEAGGTPSTFRKLSEIWYLRKIEPKMKHPKKVMGVLNKWIYPKLGKIHPADITAAHVVDCIENIIKSGW